MHDPCSAARAPRSTRAFWLRPIWSAGLASLWLTAAALAADPSPTWRMPPANPFAGEAGALAAPGYSAPALYLQPRPTGALSAEDPTFKLMNLNEPLAQGAPPGAVRRVSLEEPEPVPPSDQAAPATSPDKKADGEETTYGRKPTNYSEQFLRQQAVLLTPGAWQFDTGFAYTLFDNDFPVAVVNNTGTVTGVIEGHVRQRLLYSPLAVRYGLTENVQLFGILPVGYSNTQISTVGTSDSIDSGGIGDYTGGANTHLLKSECDYPDVVGSVSFTAPTGNFNAPLFGLAPGSALGQGFWAMSANLLFIHQYDPITVFYGAGYRHLFERSFQGASFQPGEQISYQFGVGFSVNDRVTLSTSLQGFYITTSSVGGTEVTGTNIEPISLRFAATIARRERILEPFAMIGATESAPAISCGIVVTFY